MEQFFDRAVRGRVVDYLAVKTKWKKAQAVTFNIGDLCILPGHCLCWPEDSCIKEKNDRGDRYTEEYPRESGQQKGKREEQQNCRNKGDVYRSSLDSGRRGSRRICLK